MFEKRLRIEPMNRANARQVIISTAANPKFNIELCYEEIADDIIDNVTAGGGRVQLTYLQVFLDIKCTAWQPKEDPSNIVFDVDLVKKVGSIDDVLVDFLGRVQLDVFGREVDRRDLALRWLKLFVSEKGTKIPVGRNEFNRDGARYECDSIEHIPRIFCQSGEYFDPWINDQYELTHDSLAAEIFGGCGRRVYPCRGSWSPIRNLLLLLSVCEPYPTSMAPLFFGRDHEIKDLFDKVVNDLAARTTLVFGP